VINKKLSGWSEYKHYKCSTLAPNSINDLKYFINTNKNIKKIIARGHGCSNGDQSVISNGIVIEMHNLKKIINYDKKKKIIEVEAGLKLSEILSITMKDNLFFNCIPGGLDITVGGAIANNVHGKDCFKNGYFNTNVKKIKILLSSGKLIEASKNKNKELYENIFSSQGLLGIVCSVELKLKNFSCPILEIETNVAKNKYEIEDFFKNANKSSDYLIAWLDCSFNNKGLLRGICSKSKFLKNKRLNKIQSAKYKNELNSFLKKRNNNNIKNFFFQNLWVIIGIIFGSKFFYFFNFAAFNIFKIFGKRKKNILLIQSILLHEKYLPEYNYIFKPNGFLTIQPFFNNIKPFDKIEQVILLCQKFNILPIWCPIKKYKDFNKNNLQFGGNGYSIVIEFSPYEIGIKKTEEFIHDLENLIIKQKGKIYLAKDHIISKYAFQKMYPKYKKFLSLKKKYDKSNLFISEQFIRLLT
jgi:hypothetical protein